MRSTRRVSRLSPCVVVWLLCSAVSRAKQAFIVIIFETLTHVFVRAHENVMTMTVVVLDSSLF